MFEVASLIIVNLVIAVIFGFVAGFIIAKSINPKIESIDTTNNLEMKTDIQTKSSINPIFKKNSHLDYKPLVLSSPRPVGKDNFKKLKGINTKIENDLNSLGIYHFDQIAKWSSKNCDWIEEFLLLPSGCARGNQWVVQAKILSSGKETIYSQKIERGEIEVD
jgi:predicted flap endonuclease-1-like 5' DNA nuclease